MVFLQQDPFDDMDEEELRDLLDEAEDPESIARVQKELDRRRKEREDNPPRYFLVTAIIVGLFGLVALLVYLAVR